MGSGLRYCIIIGTGSPIKRHLFFNLATTPLPVPVCSGRLRQTGETPLLRGICFALPHPSLSHQGRGDKLIKGTGCFIAKMRFLLLNFFTLIASLTFPDINGIFYLCNRGKGGMIKMGIHCDDSINTIFKRKNYKIIPYVNSTGGA